MRDPDRLLVPVGPAKEHVANLLNSGMSRRQIAAQAGVPHSSVVEMMAGQREWIWKLTETCLLGVTYRTPLRLDALGISRRLQALGRAGYGAGHVAERLDWSVQYGALWVRSLRTPRRPTVLRSTFTAIADLYAELWCTDGPSRSAARYAATAGWEPFEAWTDNTIDNPRALPYEEALRFDPELIHRVRTKMPLYLNEPRRRAQFTDLSTDEQAYMLVAHLETGGSLRSFRDKHRPVPMRLLEQLRDQYWRQTA